MHFILPVRRFLCNMYTYRQTSQIPICCVGYGDSCVYLDLQVSEAELVFNRHRREGHTFPVSVYNKILQSWVKKASTTNIHLMLSSTTGLLLC